MVFRALGGVNERGNHCLLLDDESCPILLDCGLGGPKNPYPRLTEDIARRAKLLLVSHSHLDHIGSIPKLLELGFKGRIITSETTYKTAGKPADWNCLFIAPGQTLEVEGAKITAHRAGHCLGSLWFEIELSGKRVIFSGDYLDGGAYACDPIRGQRADLAIIDGSYYGKQVPPMAESVQRLTALIREADGRVIMPAPKNGRGLCLHALLTTLGYSVNIVGKIQTTDSDLWLKDRIGAIVSDPHGRAILLTDKDFTKPETVTLVENDNERTLIFTGNLDPGSTAEHLALTRPNTARCFYNAHITQEEIDALVAANDFARVILFSSAKTDYPSDYLDFPL